MTQPVTRTIREAYVEASSFLAGRGVEHSAFNAELLLCRALGWDRTALFLHWSEPFPAERLELWRDWLERKASGEPAQYIIGEQEFYGLAFEVTPAVLIPRPETELLVEQIVTWGRKLFPADGAAAEGAAAVPRRPLVVDIGTGSGAIAVTIAAQCPAWQVATSDISPAATAVARRNAARAGVADRVRFVNGDLLEPFVAEAAEIDILVSNPPYIPSGDMAGLQREVGQFEPHTALDGGPDGLVLYRRMAEQLLQLPRLPRLVGFELGQGQAGDVEQLLRGIAGWSRLERVCDLAGIERHVIAVAE